jgi:UDPglucose 6-dehydrogenase
MVYSDFLPLKLRGEKVNGEDEVKVGIIGTGYVGLPTGLGLAEIGHEVVCIDSNAQKAAALNAGELTMFEEGLEEMFRKARAGGRIRFTTSMAEGVREADVVIIAVGTPPHPVTKEADMTFIHAAALELAPHLRGYTVVVNKSTVPVGTGDEVERLIRSKNPDADFDVASVPEFLREGFAVYDFFHPDRIVAGVDSSKAREVIAGLYAYFSGKTEMLFVRRRSSEAIKYASNAFLAMKIHYINEMADFCEKAGADVAEVARGMGLDSRIGSRFLNAGPGYGGSCFPKDTNAMAFMGRKFGVNLSLIEAAIKGNDRRKDAMASLIWQAAESFEAPKIAVWGLAFKGGTDDCRESPAIEIIEALLAHEVKITAFDPKGMENAAAILGDRIGYAGDEYDAVKEADVLAVLTEWKSFTEVDLAEVYGLMRHKNIVDLRNLLDAEKAIGLGFNYRSVGR